MEAMWTRFQPLAQEIKKVVDSGELGLPIALHADLSGDFDIESEYLLERPTKLPALLGDRVKDVLRCESGHRESPRHITGSLSKC